MAIADYWIGKGGDGFRLDAARYAIETGPYPAQADTEETTAWWVDYQTHLAGTKADFYTVGEFWTDSFDQLDGYYSSGAGLSQGFSFQFYQALRYSLYYGHSSYLLSYLSAVAGATAPPSFFAPFIDNHDEPDGNLRFMDRLAGVGNKNWELAKAGAAILLTIPGTPYVYYGTEIGMNKGPESGDAAKRTAMDWAAVNTQLADQNSLLHTWKRLLALRKQEAALRRGALIPLNVADSGVVAGSARARSAPSS
jgi:glycosidase